MSLQPRTIHPGKVLLDEVMRPLGVSRNRLARDIDVPVGRISAIVSGSRAITADTALRLAKYFGTTPELWMKLQTDYDLAVARATSWRKTDPRVRVFDSRQGNVAADTGEASLAAPAAVAPVLVTTTSLSPGREPLEMSDPEPLELTERVDPAPFEPQRRMARDVQPDEPPVLELTNRVEPSPFVSAPYEPEYWDEEEEPDYETEVLDIPKRPERS